MADVLMVTSSFLPGMGGIESCLASLCDELAPRIAVLAAPERDGKKLPDDLPYDTIPYPGRMLAPTTRVLEATLKGVAELGVDRVLFGTPWPLVLLGPRLRAAGLRYSAIVHGAELLVPAGVPGVKDRLAEALAEADMLFAVSDFTRRQIVKLLEAERKRRPPIELLRARVDLDRFHPAVPNASLRKRLGIASDDRVVLTLSRLVRRKGIDRMISALPEVARRVPEVVYVVVGTGPYESALRARAARVDARVVFAGRVADEDAPAFYALADVFALPVADRWFGLEVEGLGVVLLEAAAAGVPCVVGRSGGTPEAVIDGRTGYVIDATDGDALVAAVAGLLDDADKATAMGRAGREHVASNFSGSRIPERLLRWLSAGRTI